MQKRLFLCGALVAAALQPLAAFASVLWFGDKAGLHEIDTVANRVVLDVAFEPATALAMNAADGSVWALTKSRLARLNQQGTVQFQLSLRDLGKGLGAPSLLVLNPNDASVWVGFEKSLVHLDAAGVVRLTLALRPSDLEVAQDGSVWVLGSSSLQHLDATGKVLTSIAFKDEQNVKHIALDETGGAIWLASDNQFLKLSLSAPEKTLLSFVPPENFVDIALDT